MPHAPVFHHKFRTTLFTPIPCIGEPHSCATWKGSRFGLLLNQSYIYIYIYICRVNVSDILRRHGFIANKTTRTTLNRSNVSVVWGHVVWGHVSAGCELADTHQAAQPANTRPPLPSGRQSEAQSDLAEHTSARAARPTVIWLGITTGRVLPTDWWVSASSGLCVDAPASALLPDGSEELTRLVNTGCVTHTGCVIHTGFTMVRNHQRLRRYIRERPLRDSTRMCIMELVTALRRQDSIPTNQRQVKSTKPPPTRLPTCPAHSKLCGCAPHVVYTTCTRRAQGRSAQPVAQVVLLHRLLGPPRRQEDLRDHSRAVDRLVHPHTITTSATRTMTTSATRTHIADQYRRRTTTGQPNRHRHHVPGTPPGPFRSGRSPFTPNASTMDTSVRSNTSIRRPARHHLRARATDTHPPSLNPLPSTTLNRSGTTTLI